jgi:hypothetical protein
VDGVLGYLRRFGAGGQRVTEDGRSRPVGDAHADQRVGLAVELAGEQRLDAGRDRLSRDRLDATPRADGQYRDLRAGPGDGQQRRFPDRDDVLAVADDGRRHSRVGVATGRPDGPDGRLGLRADDADDWAVAHHRRVAVGRQKVTALRAVTRRRTASRR